MSTIKDVAEMAGVSIATVSNYLNNTKVVSKEASRRIREAIEALHYSQNAAAKALKGQRYTEIGVILPNFTDPYFVQLFHGIESAFQGSEYFLNLAFSNDIPEVEDANIRNLLRKQLCGLIIVSCQPDNWKFFYENFSAAHKPIVMIDRSIKSLDANMVSFDNYTLVYHMTNRLIDNGFRSPCLMTGPISFDCEESCGNGFLDACRSRRKTLDADELRIVQSELNKEDAFRNTVKLLKSHVPDCFISTSESTAAGIIEGLTLLGYRHIPVLSLGEDHWNLNTHSFADYSAPRPAIKIGSTAARLLMQELTHPIKETELVIFNDGADDLSDMLSVRKKRRSAAPAAPKKQELNILLLDSPVVHTFSSLIKNFEDSAGIKANLRLMPHHNIFEEVMADKNYDVVMYDIPWLATLASQGVLSDITDYLEGIDSSMFFPGALDSYGTFRSRCYGIPFMYAPQMFYYRKDLFDDPGLQTAYRNHFGAKLRPPITLKEFNAIAEFFSTMTNRIDYGVSVAAAYDECLAPELYLRLQSYGSDIFDEHGRVVFDNPQTLKAFINFKKLLKFAKPDYLQSNDVSIVKDFLQGCTAMLITYPAFLTDVYDLRKNSMIGSIGYSLIPGRTPILGGWSFGIGSRSARKEQAFAFIKWTCSKQISNYFSLMGGQTAVTATYTNDELVKLYPWLPKYYEAYSYTRPVVMPELPNGTIISSDAVDNILCKWAYKMMADEIEIQPAISNIQKELEELRAASGR